MSKEKLITQFKGKTFSSNEQVIRWLEKAIDQTREETIREVEESLPKAQKITQKDWLGLDYTLGDVKYREHAYRLLVLDILNKLKK